MGVGIVLRKKRFKKVANILRSKKTGLYLAGWDLFGKPKFVIDIKLADSMNFPTANRVKDNLRDKFGEGEFELIPQRG